MVEILNDAPATRKIIGARMIVLGLALKSKLGEPDPELVGLSVIASEEALGHDDPLTLAVRDFSRRFPEMRCDPTLLTDAGESLFRAVIRSSWPAQSDRLDLVG